MIYGGWGWPLLPLVFQLTLIGPCWPPFMLTPPDHHVHAHHPHSCSPLMFLSTLSCSCLPPCIHAHQPPFMLSLPTLAFELTHPPGPPWCWLAGPCLPCLFVLVIACSWLSPLIYAHCCSFVLIVTCQHLYLLICAHPCSFVTLCVLFCLYLIHSQ